MYMDMKRRWWVSSEPEAGVVTFAQSRDGALNMQFAELDTWEEVNRVHWERLSGRVTDDNRDMEIFYVDKEDVNYVAEKE